MMRPLGDAIPNFTILGELGRGTSGVVYETLDTCLNRRVVLNVPLLPSEPERSGKAKHRFLWGCRVLASLTGETCTSIPALHMVSEHRGQLFCVRELVEGASLEDRVLGGSINLRTGLAILAEVARVVNWLHDLEFVHCNLSAANVLISSDGITKLIGFGRVAPLAESPSCVDRGAGVSAECDIQALQDMLQELIAGLRASVPPVLEQLQRRNAVSSPKAVADVIDGYLRGGYDRTNG